jgi:hypothetical protein
MNEDKNGAAVPGSETMDQPVSQDFVGVLDVTSGHIEPQHDNAEIPTEASATPSSTETIGKVHSGVAVPGSKVMDKSVPQDSSIVVSQTTTGEFDQGDAITSMQETQIEESIIPPPTETTGMNEAQTSSAVPGSKETQTEGSIDSSAEISDNSENTPVSEVIDRPQTFDYSSISSNSQAAATNKSVYDKNAFAITALLVWAITIVAFITYLLVKRSKKRMLHSRRQSFFEVNIDSEEELSLNITSILDEEASRRSQSESVV